MALFFDQDWFQARLTEAGRTHDALAGAAGLTALELAAVWKDQMEVTREMVEGFANILGTDLRETASRCGVSTPEAGGAPAGGGMPAGEEDVRAMLKQVIARLDRIDQSVAALHELIVGEPSSRK